MARPAHQHTAASQATPHHHSGQARSERGLVRRPAQVPGQGLASRWIRRVFHDLLCRERVRVGNRGPVRRVPRDGPTAKEDIVRSRVVVAAMLVWSLLALGSCTDRGPSAPGPGPPRSASVSNHGGAQPSRSSTVLAELGRRALAFVLADGVYVGRADGAGVRRITTIPGFEYQPDWTADGTKLVLRVDDESGRAGGVWSVNADGSDPVDLVKQSGCREAPPTGHPTGPGSRLSESVWVSASASM